MFTSIGNHYSTYVPTGTPFSLRGVNRNLAVDMVEVHLMVRNQIDKYQTYINSNKIICFMLLQLNI